jgi:hypothetical protein
MPEAEREKEIKLIQRRLEQNRILDLINDFWKANPHLSFSEILPQEKIYKDKEIEKIFKEKTNGI